MKQVLEKWIRQRDLFVEHRTWQRLDDWNFTFNGYAGTFDPACQKGPLKVVRKTGNNVFEAYRQLCLMCGTSDQEGSTGLFVQIMTCKFSSKIEDVEDRLNEFLDVLDMSAHHGLQFPMVSSSTSTLWKSTSSTLLR